MAILEMARLKVVRVLQSPDGETLFVTQAAGVTIEAAREAAARTSVDARLDDGQLDGGHDPLVPLVPRRASAHHVDDGAGTMSVERTQRSFGVTSSRSQSP